MLPQGTVMSTTVSPAGLVLVFRIFALPSTIDFDRASASSVEKPRGWLHNRTKYGRNTKIVPTITSM